LGQGNLSISRRPVDALIPTMPTTKLTVACQAHGPIRPPRRWQRSWIRNRWCVAIPRWRNTATRAPYSLQTKSYAAFGQIEYHLSDLVGLTVGA
jgi:hypothetical protein